jgi:fructokinase
MYSNTGYEIEVVDTVGAGDFSGRITQNYAEVPQAIDFACALGALVAENKGANPIISNLERICFE